MIYNKLLRKVKNYIRRLGIRVGPSNSPGLIDARNDNLTPLFFDGIDKENTYLINVPLTTGRALPIHTYSRSGSHPFVHALTKAMSVANSSQLTSVQNVLQSYYERVCPESAGHVVDAEEGSRLYSFPAWAIIMPWQDEAIEEWLDHVSSMVALENKDYDRKVDISNGWAWLGPTDNTKCLIESKRLVSVFRSILENGYQRSDEHDSDILATILVKDENDWVWQSISAQHRASVLSALGYERVPVRVAKVVRREQVEFWPNVLSGLYSIDEALRVFDLVYDGDYSKITAQWLQYINADKKQ